MGHNAIWVVLAVAVIILLLVRSRRTRADEPTASPRRMVRFVGSGTYDEHVAGESKYQAALEAIAGRSKDGAEHECEARLVPEPSNRFDARAIRVEINGETVGYIPKDVTAVYHAEMKGRVGICGALIVGGWDRGAGDRGHFGVRLDVDYPPEAEVA